MVPIHYVFRQPQAEPPVESKPIPIKKKKESDSSSDYESDTDFKIAQKMKELNLSSQKNTSSCIRFSDSDDEMYDPLAYPPL